MTGVTITLGVIGVLLSLVCWASFIEGVTRMVRGILLGQKDGYDRFRPFLPRLKTMLVEVVVHTRMARIRSVGWAHWFVMVGFMFGAIVWFEAYIQTFNPYGGWPWLSNQAFYHFIEEVLALGTVIGILVLIAIRQRNNPNRARGFSRFTGSDARAAYFVEAVVLIEGLGMLMVKSGKHALNREQGVDWHWTTDFVTGPLSELLPASALMVSIFALVKLLSGMIWLYVVGRKITWGVAWHRFAAFFNIYFKREDDGGTANGAAKPMTMDGQMLTMAKVEELSEADEDFEPTLGMGTIEDFSWKGWLDFSTCTECGRCQEQCPAWNTGKPLSPKLLIMSLRDHGAAKAPYLLAGGKTAMGEETGLVDAKGNPDEAALAKIPDAARLEAQRPLVGETHVDDLAASGIIDPEALWACTQCGACVEQCPVDIEHVDHILDMRRYQVLIESEFPTELAGLFRNLENKGNPWGQNNSGRADWMKGLDFDIPVFGDDIEDFSDTEYLFWIGCAGAFEDRAKKTVRSVATLLHTAGVKYTVLSTGETCNGDSARRAGNEFLFQMLAEQNIETLDGVFDGVPSGHRKIVTTCAHCLNTLKNEYGELGGHYDVVHHTQLLNRLVRDKRLVPVAPIDGNVTYHDPCFLGRHNNIYEAPRELMDGSGVTLKEMPRHGQRSMCCGAGGARMWMEETIGKRINIDRVDEALSTNPTKIATGCPFCRVMLSDGATARLDGTEREGEVEVIDVAQLLLESVSRDGSMPEVRSPEWLEKPKRGKTRAEAAADKHEEVSELDAEVAEAGRTEEMRQAAPEQAEPELDSRAAAIEQPDASGSTTAVAPGEATDSEASNTKVQGAPKPGGLQLDGGGKAPGVKAPGGANTPGPTGAPKAETLTVTEGADASKTKDVHKSGGLQLGGVAKAPGAKALGAANPAQPAPEPETEQAVTSPDGPAEKAVEQPTDKSEGAGAADNSEAPATPKTPAVGLRPGGRGKAPGQNKK